MKFRPNQAMAYFVLSGMLFSQSFTSTMCSVQLRRAASGWPILLIFGFKTSVEVVASLYGFAFIFGSVFYLFMKEKPEAAAALESPPSVAIIYLCCDDLDSDALESLARLRHDGKRYLIIQDDSKSEASRSEVDAVAERLRDNSSWDVRVLRRPQRTGGKPGAVNYVLEQTADLYEFFLLCDNNSTGERSSTDNRESVASFSERPCCNRSMSKCRRGSLPTSSRSIACCPSPSMHSTCFSRCSRALVGNRLSATTLFYGPERFDRWADSRRGSFLMIWTLQCGLICEAITSRMFHQFGLEKSIHPATRHFASAPTNGPLDVCKR